MRTCPVAFISGGLKPVVVYLMGFALCPARRVNEFGVTGTSKPDKLILLSKMERCGKGNRNSKDEEICKSHHWKATGRVCPKTWRTEGVWLASPYSFDKGGILY